MSGYLSTATRFVATLADAAKRRCFASVSVVAVRAEAAEAKAQSTGRKRSVEDLEDSSSMPWVPDPVTGYYRPANRGEEPDPAELRQTILSNRSRR